MIGDVVILVIFWVIFLGWLCYRFYVKRDLERRKHEISTAGFFLRVMTFVYWLLLA